MPPPPPRRQPPILVPGAPRTSAARDRRWLRVGIVAAVVLAVLGVVGVVGLVATGRRQPGTRVRALAAGAARRMAAALPGGAAGAVDRTESSGRAARLACVPAVTVGAPGDVRALTSLGAAERATALLHWDGGRAEARAEGQAVREIAAQRGVTPLAVGGDGDLAVTADGSTLRALATRAPGATAQLAVSGTRELCVLD